MATLSWDEICDKARLSNKEVICEVSKRGKKRYFKVKCNNCGDEKEQCCGYFFRCMNCHIINQRSNKDEFTRKAIKVHGDKYNYDLVEYQNSRNKIKIICNNCNNIFEQTPTSHLSGYGCSNCGYQLLADKKRTTLDEYISKARAVHGDKYNYDLVEYKNSNTKVKIICNKCGNIFDQEANSHLKGCGCKPCADINQSLTVEEFIKKAKNLHGDKYNYDLVDYKNTQIKIKILCNKCGNFFEQVPHYHLDGCGCPVCKESKGENRVAQYLALNKLRYTRNKIFKTLKHKSYLKPDFYISDLNLLIEYDGKGHFEACFGSTVEDKQKNLENTQRRDKIKDEWAKANNIPLLRIPYWDFDRIEELIEAFILQHSKKEIKQLVLEI